MSYLIGKNAQLSSLTPFTQTVWFSADSLSKNKGEQPLRSKGHPELTIDDYRNLPVIVGDPLVVIEKDGFKEIFAGKEGDYYLTVVKVTKDKNELFVLSFRKSSLPDIEREMKSPGSSVVFDGR